MTPRWKRTYRRAKEYLVDGLLMRGYRMRMPDELIIETTNICTLSCSCCPNGFPLVAKRPRGVMNREVFDRILQAIDIPVRQCYLHMCGEPFVCPDLPYFVQSLAARGITPVIFSNGMCIDPGLLRGVLATKRQRISFSADILSASHYENIRKPGRFDAIMKSLSAINTEFSAANRYFGLNIIIDPTALDRLSDDVERIFNTFSHLNSISLSSQWPWPGLPQTGDLAGHMSRQPRLCEQVKSTMPILWNGDMAFCVSDFAGRTVVANILHTGSFRKAFNSRQARRFRRGLFMNRGRRLPLCDSCAFPRYHTLAVNLFRKPFLKADADARRLMLKPITDYYGTEDTRTEL